MKRPKCSTDKHYNQDQRLLFALARATNQEPRRVLRRFSRVNHVCHKPCCINCLWCLRAIRGLQTTLTHGRGSTWVLIQNFSSHPTHISSFCQCSGTAVGKANLTDRHSRRPGKFTPDRRPMGRWSDSASLLECWHEQKRPDLAR